MPTLGETAIDPSNLHERRPLGPRPSPGNTLLALARAGMLKLVAWSRILDDIRGFALADLPITLVSSNPVELGLDVTHTPPAVLRETTLGGEHFESRFAKLQMLAAGRTSTTDWRNWEHLHFYVVKGGSTTSRSTPGYWRWRRKPESSGWM